MSMSLYLSRGHVNHVANLYSAVQACTTVYIDHMRDDVTFLATVNALLGSHFEWTRENEW